MKLGNRIVAVEVLSFPVVKLTYSDAFIAVMDFSEKISWGEAMLPLRNPEVFKTAHIGSGGASLEWFGPGGEEIDFCADALRLEAEALGTSAAE